MGIKIINSFELNSPLPLDARAVANNINEMNELITKNFVVAGQMCYNKADNKLYVLKKNSEGALLSWREVADSVDLDNINKVLPTDIAVKDNKLGLEHDNVWLTNQNAINLGDNITYDATTKTLNAKGGGGEGSIKVYDWEMEEDTTTNKFYLKNVSADALGNLLTEICLINIYVIEGESKTYYAHFFITYSGINENNVALDLGFFAGNTMGGGSPSDIYHVYLVMEENGKISYNQVKVEKTNAIILNGNLTADANFNLFFTLTYTQEQYDAIQKDSIILMSFDDNVVISTVNIISTNSKILTFLILVEGNGFVICKFELNPNSTTVSSPYVISKMIPQITTNEDFILIAKNYNLIWVKKEQLIPIITFED